MICKKFGVPAVLYGHVAGFPNGDLFKGFDGENEVFVGRVTVATAVGGEPVVGGAEVRGRDDDGGAGDAPPVVVHAAQLEACAADLAAFEQRLAEAHGGHAVAALDEVSVAAGAAHRVARIRSGVVGGVRGSPLGELRRSLQRGRRVGGRGGVVSGDERKENGQCEWCCGNCEW